MEQVLGNMNRLNRNLEGIIAVCPPSPSSTHWANENRSGMNSALSRHCGHSLNISWVVRMLKGLLRVVQRDRMSINTPRAKTMVRISSRRNQKRGSLRLWNDWRWFFKCLCIYVYVCIVLFDTNNFVLSFHPIYHNIGPVLWLTPINTSSHACK